MADQAWARDVAGSESRFRDSNERLRVNAGRLRFEGRDRAPFVCECADASCFESVMVSLDEYDRVRGNARWFLLAIGHGDAETACEHVVETAIGYSIVEKTGAAGVEAARLHHRQNARAPAFRRAKSL